MINAVYGIKQIISQTWLATGQRVPVTKVRVEPLVVTQRKTLEKDGYNALQLGFGNKKIKNITKPLQGHLKKSQNSNLKAQNLQRYLKEIKISQTEDQQLPELSGVIQVSDVLNTGDLVKVTGVSKGKGFAGGVKRWGFAGGPRTHGQSDRERAPGSIGQGTTPGRVYKGKRMAGRMGARQRTICNLTVLDVQNDGTVLLSGLVPGARGSVLRVEKTGHNKKFPGLMSNEQTSEQLATSTTQIQENPQQEETQKSVQDNEKGES